MSRWLILMMGVLPCTSRAHRGRIDVLMGLLGRAVDCGFRDHLWTFAGRPEGAGSAVGEVLIKQGDPLLDGGGLFEEERRGPDAAMW